MGHLPIPADLVDDLFAGRVVLFLSNTPGEDRETGECGEDDLGLANRLSQILGIPKTSSNLPTVAQQFASIKGPHALIQTISDLLQPVRHSPSRVHLLAAQLPVPLYITTDIHLHLEDALAQENRRFDKVIRGLHWSGTRNLSAAVVKLFGDLSAKDDLYLTTRQRLQRIHSDPFLSEVLPVLLTGKRLVLIQPDMGDQFLQELLSPIFAAQGKFVRLAYAIKPVRAEAGESFWEDHEIKVIDCEPKIFLKSLAEALHHNTPPQSIVTHSVEGAQPTRPFKFLDYFDEKDTSIFFGRDDEIGQLTTLIRSSRLSILTGESGVGKTSVLLAGAFPRLRSANYLTVQVRFDEDPLISVKRSVVGAGRVSSIGVAIENALSGSKHAPLASTLTELVQSIQEKTGKPIVLAIDQFEEFFNRYPHHAQQRFTKELAELLNRWDIIIHVAILIREDAFARLLALQKEIPQVVAHSMSLPRLSPSQARVAIAGPLEVFAIDFDTEFVERLLEDLGKDGKIAPPQLQIVCDTLYQEIVRAGGKVVTYSLYESLGGAEQILARYLENALAELPGSQQVLAREVLKVMVTSERAKDVLSIKEIAIYSGIGELETGEIVSYLINRRLIRKVSQREQPETVKYELAHDTLALRISEWLEEPERRARIAREILQRGLVSWQRFGLLLRPEELSEIESESQNPYLRPDNAQTELLIRSGLEYDIGMGAWLGLLKNVSDSAPILCGGLRSINPEVRCRAAYWIGQENLQYAAPDLLELALRDSDATVRQEAGRALITVEPLARSGLLVALDEQSTGVPAAQALWKHQDTLRLTITERAKVIYVLSIDRLTSLSKLSARQVPKIAFVMLAAIIIVLGLFLGGRAACEKGSISNGSLLCEYLLPATVAPVEPLDHEMVKIPGGEFISELTGSESIETLPSFLIDVFEVTNEKYQQCVLAGICRAPVNAVFDLPEYSGHPVTDVSLPDAESYCQWIEGDLPSELHWERAARGTSGFSYPWGNEVLQEGQANICDSECPAALRVEAMNDGFALTAPVGSFPAGSSQQGVQDLVGNVWEWTKNGVARGGSWNNDRRLNKATSRVVIDSETRDPSVGFRCMGLADE